jgi:hypothetical protein
VTKNKRTRAEAIIGFSSIFLNERLKIEPHGENFLNLLDVKLAYIFRLPWTAFSVSPRSEQLPVR